MTLITLKLNISDEYLVALQEICNYCGNDSGKWYYGTYDHGIKGEIIKSLLQLGLIKGSFHAEFVSEYSVQQTLLGRVAINNIPQEITNDTP